MRNSADRIHRKNAKKVADEIGIPHYTVDFRDQFRTCVMDYFCREYLEGRTPNPCVVCNRYVKWEALLGWAKEIGADQIATGHYANIVKLPNRTLRGSECGCLQKRPDLCALQSHPGSACPHPDAGGKI